MLLLNYYSLGGMLPHSIMSAESEHDAMPYQRVGLSTFCKMLYVVNTYKKNLIYIYFLYNSLFYFHCKASF